MDAARDTKIIHHGKGRCDIGPSIVRGCLPGERSSLHFTKIRHGNTPGAMVAA